MGAIVDQLKTLRLQAKRRKQGPWRTKDLGAIIGSTSKDSPHSNVSKIEGGDTVPDADQIEAWAGAFGAEVVIAPRGGTDELAARASKLDHVDRDVVKLFIAALPNLPEYTRQAWIVELRGLLDEVQKRGRRTAT